MAVVFQKTFVDALTGANGFDSVTTTNGTIGQSAGAGLNGTSGGVTVTQTGLSPSVYGTITSSFVGKTFYRTAWYLDADSIAIANAEQVTRLITFENAAGTTTASMVILRLTGGALNFQHYVVNDAGTSILNSIPVASGYPAWMEFRLQRSSGAGVADAQSHLYFGGGGYPALGSLVSTHTGFIHYTRFEQDSHRLGLIRSSSSVSGVYIVDEWILRDDDTPILFGVVSEESSYVYQNVLSHSLGLHF